MKLLVLSDAHGARWHIDRLVVHTNPDAIVIPGDLPSSIDFPVLVLAVMKNRALRGIRREYTVQAYQRFNERLTFRQIRTAKRLMLTLEKFNLPIILIHGNTETFETRAWLELFCHRNPNFHWIADDTLTINGTQFIGHGWVAYEEGYERVPTPGEVPAFVSDDILKRTLRKMKRKVDRNILISHAPPYGTPLDYLAHKREHAGSKPVRAVLERGRVDGVICGNLHESRGSYNHQGKWWGVNAGSVIDDIACTIDLLSNTVIWYEKIIYKFGLSPILYHRRHTVQYDTNS